MTRSAMTLTRPATAPAEPVKRARIGGRIAGIDSLDATGAASRYGVIVRSYAARPVPARQTGSIRLTQSEWSSVGKGGHKASVLSRTGQR